MENIFKFKQEILGAFVVTMALLLMIYFVTTAKPKPENLDMKLQELCKKVPLDSQMQRSPRSIIGTDGGTYSIEFSTKLTYQQVKSYYLGLYTLEGWEMSEDSKYDISDFEESRYLGFRKDGYDIEIQPSNLNEDNSRKTFSVTCGWKSY